MTTIPAPSSTETLRAVLDREISLRARLGTLLLLFADLAMLGVVGALLLTETGLPARTRASFVVLLLIGLAWAAFFVWTLTRRRPMHARQNLVAAWMALAASTLFTLGALLVAFTSDPRALAAAAYGLAMIALAVALLVRARSRRRELLALRDLLESRLAGEMSAA